MEFVISSEPIGSRNLIDTVSELLDKRIHPLPNTGTVIMEPAPSPRLETIKWLGGKAAKGAVKVMGLFSDEGVNKILAKSQPIFKGIAQRYLRDNDISLDITSLILAKNGETLYITTEIKNIDCAGILNKYLPDILDYVRKKAPDSPIPKIADIAGNKSEAVVKAALNVLTEEQKEAVISLIAKTYHDVICRKMTDFLIKHEVGLRVTSIGVR